MLDKVVQGRGADKYRQVSLLKTETQQLRPPGIAHCPLFHNRPRESFMIKRNIARSDDADAFIRESDQQLGSQDDLAQRLAEEYLKGASSGDDSDGESRDELLIEELGGPFIESRPEEEFGDTIRAGKTDPDVEASPLPQAVGSLTIAAADEEIEAVETSEEQGLDDIDFPAPDAEGASRLEPDIHEIGRPIR